MKKVKIEVRSNFHDARGSRSIWIPQGMSLDDYLVDLSYRAYQEDGAARRRLRHIETLFCGKQSGCECGIVEA